MRRAGLSNVYTVPLKVSLLCILAMEDSIHDKSCNHMISVSFCSFLRYERWWAVLLVGQVGWEDWHWMQADSCPLLYRALFPMTCTTPDLGKQKTLQIANCKCCPVSLLIVRSQWLSWTQVLNLNNFTQVHKSPGSLFEGFCFLFVKDCLQCAN